MPDPHPPTVPVDLDRTVFRSNGAYQLVVFDRLPADQQEMLSDLKKQPEFYGVLRAVGDSGMGVKSVSRETALLFLTMKEPGALPEYARALLAADKGAAISRLVLDQVLEIEDGGRFLCGAEAYQAVVQVRQPVTRRVARFSSCRSAHSSTARLSTLPIRFNSRCVSTTIIGCRSRVGGARPIPIGRRSPRGWASGAVDGTRRSYRVTGTKPATLTRTGRTTNQNTQAGSRGPTGIARVHRPPRPRRTSCMSVPCRSSLKTSSRSP